MRQKEPRSMSDNLLVLSVQQKVREAIERTGHLIALAPEDCLEWRPLPQKGDGHFIDAGHVLGHLLTCLGGFCSVLLKAYPEKLAHFADLQWLKTNHCCPPAEALERLRSYAAFIDEGFLCCSDADLMRVIPTVLVPEGETMLSLLLNNLEHLNNHKYQLFVYLKLLGVPVGSRDLYKFHERKSEVAQAERSAI
jgi:uncharacterized damage-inducible protein DinB